MWRRQAEEHYYGLPPDMLSLVSCSPDVLLDSCSCLWDSLQQSCLSWEVSSSSSSHHSMCLYSLRAGQWISPLLTGHHQAAHLGWKSDWGKRLSLLGMHSTWHRLSSCYDPQGRDCRSLLLHETREELLTSQGPGPLQSDVLLCSVEFYMCQMQAVVPLVPHTVHALDHLQGWQHLCPQFKWIFPCDHTSSHQLHEPSSRCQHLHGLHRFKLVVSSWGGRVSTCSLSVTTSCVPSLLTNCVTCSDMKLKSSFLLSPSWRMFCQLLHRGAKAVIRLQLPLPRIPLVGAFRLPDFR